MKTRCLIVDDEPLAIEVIENHLSHFRDTEIVGKFQNAMDAFELLKTTTVDVIFLDIQMPYLTGLQFLRSLTNPPKAILTTAYFEYAVEGFELDVVDYLLKPISFERFLKAMNKFYELKSPKVDDIQQEIKNDKTKNYIFVKADKKSHKIYLDDILFIQSLKDYVRIITGRKKVITKIPISKLEEELSGDDFIRVHRSYIISLNKIDSFNSEVIDISGNEIPIGRQYKTIVIDVLKSSDIEL